MDKVEKRHYIESLFGKYYSDLVGYIRSKYRRQQGCAEDIAQDAFLRLQRMEEFKGLYNPKAHLYKTASNLAIDRFRRDKVKENYLSFLSDRSEQECADTPENIVELEYKLRELDESLQVLSENCRKAFILHRVHGNSYKEIANQLDISVSSVEKYLCQALQHSRDVLLEEYDNGK